MTEDPDVLFGFDASLNDDVSVVVMRRDTDGVWRMESGEGPDAATLAAQFTTATPAPTPDDGDQPSLTDQVRAWTERYARMGNPQFELTEWQKAAFQAIYSAAIADGRLTLHRNDPCHLIPRI